MARQRAKRRTGHSTNVTDLPDQVLLLVFQHTGLARLAAAQACKHWRDLSHDATFCHKVPRGGCIAAALSTAGPGDTVELACGMYEASAFEVMFQLLRMQEALLLDKPLKVVGAASSTLSGQPKLGVLLFTRRSVLVLCAARCCLQGLHLHAKGAFHHDRRSTVTFGPGCPFISLINCKVHEGWFTVELATTLRLQHCELVAGSRRLQNSTGVLVYGTLIAEGCTFTGWASAINVIRAALQLRHCQLELNTCAIRTLLARGLVTCCLLWGNGQTLLSCGQAWAAIKDTFVTQVPVDETEAAGPAGCRTHCCGLQLPEEHTMLWHNNDVEPKPPAIRDEVTGQLMRDRQKKMRRVLRQVYGPMVAGPMNAHGMLLDSEVGSSSGSGFDDDSNYDSNSSRSSSSSEEFTSSSEWEDSSDTDSSHSEGSEG